MYTIKTSPARLTSMQVQHRVRPPKSRVLKYLPMTEKQRSGLPVLGSRQPTKFSQGMLSLFSLSLLSVCVSFSFFLLLVAESPHCSLLPLSLPLSLPIRVRVRVRLGLGVRVRVRFLLSFPLPLFFTLLSGSVKCAAGLLH